MSHINIETDFFGEEEYHQSESQHREQSIIFYHEKSAIIIENTLESARLRRIIWVFRLLARGQTTGNMLSPEEEVVEANSRKKRQHTDTDHVRNNSRSGSQSRSQSRVLTRKKSESFHNFNRSEAKESRRAILQGIRQKLQAHSISKPSKEDASQGKQTQQANQLDRRVRKLENLMRNIRKDKQISQPSIVHEKKILKKMPQKEEHSQNFAIFIEEIQKLREEVSQLKQLNESLVRSSRARSEHSLLTTPRDSGVYEKESDSQTKQNGSLHIATYNIKSIERGHSEAKNQSKKQFTSLSKPSTPRQFDQSSRSIEKNNQNKPTNYEILINSLRSPKVPTGEDISHKAFEASHIKYSVPQNQNDKQIALIKPQSQKKLQIKPTNEVNTKRISEQNYPKPQKKQYQTHQSNNNNSGKRIQDLVFNIASYDPRISQRTEKLLESKYSSEPHPNQEKKEFNNYDRYLEKDQSKFDYRSISGYSGNYTPGQGGYTNPELLKRLGFSVQKQSPLKSFDIIKNTTSEPYPDCSNRSSVDVKGKIQQRRSSIPKTQELKQSPYLHKYERETTSGSFATHAVPINQGNHHSFTIAAKPLSSQQQVNQRQFYETSSKNYQFRVPLIPTSHQPYHTSTGNAYSLQGPSYNRPPLGKY